MTGYVAALQVARDALRCDDYFGRALVNASDAAYLQELPRMHRVQDLLDGAAPYSHGLIDAFDCVCSLLPIDSPAYRALVSLRTQANRFRLTHGYRVN